MEYHGPFGGSKSFYGYRIDTLKSALQKYIRRADVDKAIKCALELDFFYKIPKAKGIRTNMVNRLRIISCEEFGDSNPSMYKFIDAFLEKWNKTRDLDNKIESVRQIVKIINLYSLIPKSRVLSHIRAAYLYNVRTKQENRDFYVKKGNRWGGRKGPKLSETEIDNRLEILDNIKNEYSNLYENINGSQDISSIVKSGDPEILREYMGKFVYYFNMKDHKCFYWAFKIQDLASSGCKASRRYRKQGCEYILWEFVIANAGDRLEPINILFTWYNKYKSERWMYLINAIKIALADYQNPEILSEPSINDEHVNKLLEKHYAEKFIVDDFCIDQHTKSGRIKNRSHKFFACIGSQIVNPSKNIIEKYLCIYNKIKWAREGEVLQPKKKKKIKIKKKQPTITFEKLQKLPRGQLRCGKSKKSVFISNKYVYKGPYQENDKKMTNNVKFTKQCLKIEEILGIDEKYRTTLKIVNKLNFADGIYLVFKNIGKIDDSSKKFLVKNKGELEKDKQLDVNKNYLYTKVQDDIGKYVYGRNVLKRIIDVRKTNQQLFTDDVKIAVLQHLYMRFILNIGDSGDHNILLREDDSSRLIAGIDLEEIRGSKKPTNKLECLFKMVSSDISLKYSPFLKNIKQMDLKFIDKLQLDEHELTSISERIQLFKAFT